MTCYDCIYAIYDGPDREVGPGSSATYCRLTHKTIMDPWGEGDQEICKNFKIHKRENMTYASNNPY